MTRTLSPLTIKVRGMSNIVAYDKNDETLCVGVWSVSEVAALKRQLSKAERFLAEARQMQQKLQGEYDL